MSREDRPLDSGATLGRQFPPASDGLTIYAIGDIHGRADLLADLYRKIDADKLASQPQRVAEIYLGDYIDRGSDPAAVVETLVRRSGEVDSVFLRGNHEQLLLDFVAGEQCLDAWKAVGAIPTLLSYGVPPRLLTDTPTQEEVRRAFSERLPREHHEFFALTGAYCESGRYLFVHAGIRPGVELEYQAREDILGIRDEFLKFDGDFGWIVIHGHTPVTVPDFKVNRINIDTGAYASHCLTCLRIGEHGTSVIDTPLSDA
jgi:serine/threonine protein phosphatase 1